MEKSMIFAITGVMLALTACGKASDSSNEMQASREIVEDATPLSDGSDVLGAPLNGEAFYDGPLRVLTVILNGGGDASTLEGNGFSPDYYEMVQDSEEGLSRIGYAIFDLNGDGVPELFIGDRESSLIYDIYTTVDGEPEQVVSGGARNRFYLQGDDWFCNEYSNGAAEFGWNVYGIIPGSSRLFFQWGYKYDAYENEVNPWYTTDVHDQWVQITEDEFNKAVEVQNDNFKVIDFKPLSEWGKE